MKRSNTSWAALSLALSAAVSAHAAQYEFRAPNKGLSVVAGSSAPSPAPDTPAAPLTYLASVSSTTLSFDTVALGAQAYREVLVSNEGTGTLTLGAAHVSAGGFSASTNCAQTLAPGASCLVGVTWTPTQTGAESGTLTLNSSATNAPLEVSLSGLAEGLVPTLSASPASASIAAYPTITGTSTIRLSNIGTTGPLTLSGLSLSGTHAHKFSVVSGCAAGTVLSANGGSCDVVVRFIPGTESLASMTATLNAAHSGAGGSLAVSLSGNSTFPEAVWNYPSGATASISGQTATWTSGQGAAGLTAGSTRRAAGKFLVRFTGSPSSLASLEYALTAGGSEFYALSFPQGKIIKSATTPGGSANNAAVSLPSFVSGDSVLMALDNTTLSARWYKCTSAGVCTQFHSASNLWSGKTMLPYVYKTVTNAVTVTMQAKDVPFNPAGADYFNAQPN